MENTPKNSNFVITVVIALLVLAGIGWFVFLKQNDTLMTDLTPPEEDTSTTEPVLGVDIPHDFDSTLTGMQQLVTDIDAKLSDPTLALEERVALLLDKGYLQVMVRSSSDIDSAISEANKQFDEANKLISQNPVLKERYSVSGKFGYLYNYVSNCFARPVVWGIPQKYHTYFTELGTYNMNSLESITAYQRGSFQSMIDYAYNDPDLAASNDKSIISHRMFAVAIYLASYGDTISTDERAALLNHLSEDFVKFGTGTFNIFAKNGTSEPLRGEMVSKFHYAVAYDIFTSLSSPTLTAEENNAIDAYYSIVRADLNNSTSANKVALAMIGMQNDGYHLSSAYRRYGNDPKNLLFATLVASFKENVFAAPEVSDITKGSFNYTLSLNGAWGKEKAHIFELAQINSELRTIFTATGVRLDEYKKL